MQTRTIRFFLVIPSLALLLAGCGENGSPNAPAAPRAPGSIQLDISGLPDGLGGEVRLSASGYDQLFTSSQLIEGLTPNRYTIHASNVDGVNETYVPTPGLSTVDVYSDRTSSASVGYLSSGGSSLDLRILAAYLVQTTQRLDGTVPLVAGRSAMLRVFATANRDALVRPDVEVELYDADDQLMASYSIPARVSAMPTSIDQGNLDASWMVLIPSSQVVPGLKFVARVDPENGLAETDETNNVFPPTGDPVELDVRSVPDLQVRFVPVRQSVTGLTGDVNSGNAGDFVEFAEALYPTAEIDFDVAATYTTDAPALVPDDSNDAWVSVLSELWALQQLDPVRERHYYGVVDVNYTAGIAGIAYIGQPAGIGRDLSYSNLFVVFPHELGHNLGLPHASCGVTGGDPNYPYPEGQIGVYGFDAARSVLKAPSLVDIMGYCPNVWISDYNYENALSYREQNGKRDTRAFGSNVESCYLVWGRMDATEVTLEPVLELKARAVVPTAGPQLMELEFADGRRQTLRFTAERVADHPDGQQQQFAFLLPVDDFGASSLKSVRVRSETNATSARVAPLPDSGKRPAQIRAMRGAADVVQLEWDALRYPMICVRDAATGDVLSFARNGRTEIVSRGREWTISASDGVRSEIRALSVDQ